MKQSLIVCLRIKLRALAIRHPSGFPGKKLDLYRVKIAIVNTMEPNLISLDFPVHNVNPATLNIFGLLTPITRNFPQLMAQAPNPWHLDQLADCDPGACPGPGQHHAGNQGGD